MNIQGIGQTFTTCQSMNMGSARGTNGSFNPLDMDSGKILEKEDANLDGVLTIDETHMSEDMFSSADADSDGVLTSEELEEMLASGPLPMMGTRGGMGNPPPDQMDAESIIKIEDTDEDGSISLEESSLPNEIFSELDTDQDGLISQVELEAGMTAKQEQMDNMQQTASNQTITQETAIEAYRTALESFFTEFTDSSLTDSNLNSFLGTIA